MFERLIPNAAASYQHQTPENAALQQSAIATSMGFRPDMESNIDNASGNHIFCKLNRIGFIPVVSTFSGAYRTLVGLAYFIKSIVCLIFDAANRTQHLEGLKIAAANIGRGLLEIIPVVGNLFVLNIDVSRMMYRWSDSGVNRPYGDQEGISIFSKVDALGAIPILGTVINLIRALFFTIHILVNVPSAITCNEKSYKAIEFGASQVAIGLFESIPIVGTISVIVRNLQPGR